MDKPHDLATAWSDDPWLTNIRPGYRLKKLEVTNWGTFDSSSGQVYSLSLEGRTTLLVGQNGSGKSTLVDALLTLLVQPGVRNYNVAAGAKKRERDERTYIRGACGRSSDDELGSVTDYLRPNDNHYSVLLACFERADTGQAFTIAQVLQITGDGEVDKTYAFCDRERSVAPDFSGLVRGERIRKQLIDRGFQATTKYSEYFPWMARHVHLRPKAMDVFNQTVAVKDIQSLNRFIREHMLEPHPWRERIEGLLAHFTQLSQAHQSLVNARKQLEALVPIEAASAKYQELAAAMHRCQRQIDGVDSFFRERMLAWLVPRINRNHTALSQAKSRKLDLQTEIEALDETQRFLKNEIENSGGQRLQQLPLMVETQQALLTAKRRERQRLENALSLLGVDWDSCGVLDSREAFQSLPLQLTSLRERLSEVSTHTAERRLQLARELNEVRSALEETQSQCDEVRDRTSNLPTWLNDVRTALARNLALPESELVFACELMSVLQTELAWQPAIEMVLRRLALSLLVSEEHYGPVSHYIEHHALVDNRGRGQRLVYYRVPNSITAATRERLHPDSLLNKLAFRFAASQGTVGQLSQWLESELRRRYDYRCCESMDQFHRAPGLALTPQRHIKIGLQQHEKDDRPQTVDSNRFVLGWDNSQRVQELQANLSHQRARESEIVSDIEAVETQGRQVSKQLMALETALGVPDFDLIDTQRHQREIAALQGEQTAIEDSNDAARTLRQRLDAAIERRFAAQRERDTQVAVESQLVRDSEQAAELMERHQQVLAARHASGSLNVHQLAFDDLAQSLSERLARIQDLSGFAELQAETSQAIQKQLNQLVQRAEPLRGEVIRAMQKFLSENPQERHDLRAEWSYLDGFLGLLDQLRVEDLPRHEQRFRERLNDKVLQELGIFYAALQCERQEILSKIEILNTSLQQLEYRPGTYMRLESRGVSDREIRDFQNLLRDCLDDAFDGEQAADESRFVQIERLIRRLGDEERWREKVTDVRRWFDFTARELDASSGVELSCYEDSSGQSGGEKAKLAFTILVAAIAYQFDIDPAEPNDDRLHFVVVDEMFSKVDDRYAEYALQLFEKFGLQLLIVAPLDAKARVTEPYVGCYLHTVKHDNQRTSEVFSLSAVEYERAIDQSRGAPVGLAKPK